MDIKLELIAKLREKCVTQLELLTKLEASIIHRKQNQQNSIELSWNGIKELTHLYLKHLGDEKIEWCGHVLLTSYTKYLLEYTWSKFPDCTEKTEFLKSMKE